MGPTVTAKETVPNLTEPPSAKLMAVRTVRTDRPAGRGRFIRPSRGLGPSPAPI